MNRTTTFQMVLTPNERKARIEFERLTEEQKAKYEAAVDCGADHEDAMYAATR
jgi:hypothetical protein